MTLEELEIVVKANVEEATTKLNGLKAQLSGVTDDGFSQITEQSQEMGEAVAKSGESVAKMAPQVGTLASETTAGATATAGFSQAIAGVGVAIKSALPVLLAISAVIVVIVSAINKITDQINKLKKTVKTVLDTAKKLIRDLNKQLERATFLMINLAKRGINNLVQVSDSLNKSLSELKSSTTQLGNTLATAISPIIQALTPMLLRLLEIIINVADGLAQITASLFGGKTTYLKATKVNQNYAKSVAGIGKAVKGTLASFDELNVLSEQSGAGGGLAGAFTETDIDEKILELTKELKDLWDTDNIEGLRDFGARLGKKLKDQIDGIPASDIGQTIGKKITDALALVNGFLRTEPFRNIGEKIADFILGLVSEIRPEELGSLIANVINTAFGLARRFVETMNANNGWRKLGVWIAQTLNNLIRGLNIDDIAGAIAGFVEGLLDLGISFYLSADWDLYGEKIFEGLQKIPWKRILTKFILFLILQWNSKQEMLFGFLGNFFSNLGDWTSNKVKGIGELIISWAVKIGQDVAGMVISGIEMLKLKIEWFIEGAKTLLSNISAFVEETFKPAWESAWQGIKTGWENLWGGMKSIAKGAVNTIIDFVNGLITAVEKGVNAVVDTINSINIVNPFNGEEIWSPNIKRVRFDRIPRLAKGRSNRRADSNFSGRICRSLTKSRNCNTSKTIIRNKHASKRTSNERD